MVNNAPAAPWRVAGLSATVIAPFHANAGFAGGNNLALRGLQSGGSTYALLLNNDAVPAPDALAALVARAESDARIALVGARVEEA
ncbi:MAG: hypothetical protein U0802_14800 [Candidatus Binatia bacterium]